MRAPGGARRFSERRKGARSDLPMRQLKQERGSGGYLRADGRPVMRSDLAIVLELDRMDVS